MKLIALQIVTLKPIFSPYKTKFLTNFEVK